MSGLYASTDCQRTPSTTAGGPKNPPMNLSIMGLPRIGAFLFCSMLLRYGLNFSGARSLSVTAGMSKASPVIGGESFSSRALSPNAAAMFPPADVPPTMKPADGSAPRLLALSAACVESRQHITPIKAPPLAPLTHFTASHESSTAYGNANSGANRYPGFTAVQPSRCTNSLQFSSSPSRSPRQNPPPCMKTTSGLPAAGGCSGV